MERRQLDYEGGHTVYHDGGEGFPVLLIHGFASTARVNWISTSWTKTLLEAGYRVIALDNRGHGESAKFHRPEDYGPDIFAADALRLLDHLKIERCHVIGYSMGARITAWLCHAAPERIDHAVFGGMGEHIYGGRGGYDVIAEALETETPESITDPKAQTFRAFADKTGSDRLALAACIRPSRFKLTPEIVGAIETPVLVAVGTDDDVAGKPEPLAETLPNGVAAPLQGLDHMKATGAPSFKRAVLDFLPPASGGLS